MPIVDISFQHSVERLKKKYLANKKLTMFSFSEIYEIIKLKIDETGVTVENEGVIKMRKMLVVKKNPKYILLDGPFWMLMR